MGAYTVLLLSLLAAPVMASDASGSPVSKVITLLKDMVTQLEKEAEEDADVYEEMQCWCTTNEKEKKKSISDAESTISTLTSTIEELTANSAKLNTEIANLEKEVEKNSEALDKATALRKKELAEFNAEEKSSLQTIASLKAAVTALSKHHEAALLQQEPSTNTMDFLKAVAGLSSVMHREKAALSEVLTPKQRRTLAAFVQSPEDATELSLIQSSSTAPASGEIFGMLKQMKESFEQSLTNAQKEETQSEDDFQSLKAAKTEEIAAGTALAEKKTAQLASTDEKNAQSKEDLEDTQATLAADTEFLAVVMEKCSALDAEYAERTKTRQLEIQAVSKALAFLSSDEAHDLFSRTLSFVQTRVTLHSKRRAQTSKILAAAAHKFKDPKLLQLSAKARIDAFTEVKKAIQDMVDQLVKEKEDEIKLRDFCIEELNSNEAQTEQKQRDKADLGEMIEDLATTIETLGKEIEVLKAEVAELQVQMKRAGEDREKANQEFQITVADQRATQKLLTAALGILKGFYEKAALLQKSHHNGKQPEFKSYEKNKKSGGVMGMMEGIIGEAKALEAEAIRAEEDSQKSYEEMVKETNNAVDEKTKSIMNKSDAKAKAEVEKVQATDELAAVESTLQELANANADLHSECDFTLKNFELRQTARDDEIGALKQAMSIFSGASFSAFLQNADYDPKDDPDLWW